MSATTCYAFQKLNKISAPCWRLSVDCATETAVWMTWPERESETEREWDRARDLEEGLGGRQTRSERDTRTEIHSSVANLLVVWIHHKASERSFVADHQLKNRANDEHKTWACGYVCAQCDGVWMGSLDSKCLCWIMGCVGDRWGWDCLA